MAVTQVLSAASTTSSVTYPSGIQAGDLIVVLDFARSPSQPSDVNPSGYTLIQRSAVIESGGFAAQKLASWLKIATGSETGSLSLMNGSSSNAKVIVVFRGGSPISSAAIQDPDSETTTSNPAAQSVSASGGDTPLIVLGFYSSSSAISPRTFSPAKDGEVGASNNLGYLAWKIYESSPADVSIDMDDEGAGNSLHSCYVELVIAVNHTVNINAAVSTSVSFAKQTQKVVAAALTATATQLPKAISKGVQITSSPIVTVRKAIDFTMSTATLSIVPRVIKNTAIDLGNATVSASATMFRNVGKVITPVVSLVTRFLEPFIDRLVVVSREWLPNVVDYVLAGTQPLKSRTDSAEVNPANQQETVTGKRSKVQKLKGGTPSFTTKTDNRGYD